MSTKKHIDINVKIGGQAGQGIQTVGDLLALVCYKAGLYIMAINDYESRIRGGHNFLQIRISNTPVLAPNHKVNILVSLDEKTRDFYEHELLPDGIVIVNKQGSSDSRNVLNIPFEDLAKKAGGAVMANTVAAGVCLCLLGTPFDLVRQVLTEQFSSKGEKMVSNNISAAQMGYEASGGIKSLSEFGWDSATISRPMMEGAAAFALGAIAGDCRFASFYPMSPATNIINHLSALSGKFPVLVEQAEDEIAAVNMVIGASFAGVRSMTATSGGGFCLMTEGLGLAGITETPLVIINAQRPGPATGLPTRTAQADLLFVINASQDEFPRFVFAPGSVDEAFEITARAFELAEKYQVPVIILSDHFFNSSIFVAEKDFKAKNKIEKWIMPGNQINDPAGYKRFARTSSGISPRILPCSGDALVVVTGNEHSEDGHISEAISDRTAMVEKRNAKLSEMLEEIRPPNTFFEDCEILLCGWGSTKGAIKEAVEQLRQEGFNVGSAHFSDLWPFPAYSLKKLIKKGKKIVVVEQNSTAQLGRLIREQTGFEYDKAILKYDGRPFYPIEIVEYIKNMR